MKDCPHQGSHHQGDRDQSDETMAPRSIMMGAPAEEKTAFFFPPAAVLFSTSAPHSQGQAGFGKVCVGARPNLLGQKLALGLSGSLVALAGSLTFWLALPSVLLAFFEGLCMEQDNAQQPETSTLARLRCRRMRDFK